MDTTLLAHVNSFAPAPNLPKDGKSTVSEKIKGGNKWTPVPEGKIIMPDGSSARWMNIHDGDSPYYLSDPNVDPNTLGKEPGKVPGAYGGRALGFDAFETSHNAKKPADAFANSQWQYYSDLHDKLIENGYSIKLEHQGQDGTGTGRDLVLENIYNNKGELVGDVSSIMLRQGMAVPLAGPSNTNTNTKNFWDFQREADEASTGKEGIWNPTLRATWETDQAKLGSVTSSKRKGKHNTKYGQDDPSRRGTYIGEDEWKIGDVYLPVNPTSLSISQVRTSYTTPLIGYEAKPTSSYTARTVIKVQCIFPDAVIGGDLQRILLQFKYCPVNLIRSKDLFNKVAHAIIHESDTKDKAGNKKYVSTLQRDYADTWTVPVTMDEWTIYTIEGHPWAVGAIFQFSLFNYTAYFNDSALDRIEYFKYIHPKDKADWTSLVFGREVTKKYIMDNDPRLAELIRRKSVSIPNTDKILYRDKTLNLEDAIHPYNFNVEDDMAVTAESMAHLHGRHDGASSLKLWKVSAAVTAKQIGIRDSNPEVVSEHTQTVNGSLITEQIVKSVSIKFENTFGWLPVVGYGLPCAQYIGPGATHVSINFNTADPTTVSRLMKTYNELAEKDELFGIYDDRYIVSSYLTIFANAEMCSLKDLTTNSVPGHPGVTDVNIMLQKTEYMVNARSLNPAAEFDKYWGLNRILSPLANDEYYKLVKQLVTQYNSKIPDAELLDGINPRGVYLNGLRATTKEAANIVMKRLTQISGGWPATNFPDGKSRTGETLYKKLEIVSAAANASGDASDFINTMVQFIDSKANSQGYIDNVYWDIKALFTDQDEDNRDPDVLVLRERLLAMAYNTNRLNTKTYSYGQLVNIARGLPDNQGKTIVANVYNEMKDFWDMYGQYWRKSVYAQASGKSIVLNFFGYPVEVSILQKVLGAGMTPGDSKSQNKATMQEYSAYWSEADQRNFPAFSVSAIAETDAKVGSSVKKLDPNTQYNFSIGMSYLHLRGRGVKQISDTPDVAAIQKITKELNAKMKNLDMESKTLAKPFAAHRYYPQIENFIAHDTLLSSSVGDWFTDSQVMNLDATLGKIGKMVNEIKSPISDTPAWRAAFRAWRVTTDKDQRFEQMINDSGPLGVLQAVAYPDAKRDMSFTGDPATGKRPLIKGAVDTAINIIPSAWRNNEESIRAGKAVNKYDQPLSSMSQLFFAKGYFGQAQKIATEQNKFISTLIEPKSYLNKGSVSAIQALNSNLGAQCVVLNNGKGAMIGAGEATLFDITNGLIPNRLNINSAINKTIKYEGTWVSNSANIAQQKNPIANDVALSSDFSTSVKAFKGFESEPKKAMNSKSNPGIIFDTSNSPENLKKRYSTYALGYDPLNTTVIGTEPIKPKAYQQNKEKYKADLKKYGITSALAADTQAYNNASAEHQAFVAQSKKYFSDNSTVGVPTPFTDALLEMALEDKYGEVSNATKWNLGQKYLMSQLPTSGMQNAFPTYKLYIIKSDTSDYKFYSLDDYYDFRLVQDLMIIRDRNNPVHMLKARVIIDPRYVTISDAVRQKYVHDNELREGQSAPAQDSSKVDTKESTLWSMGRIPLRVGMRICCKLGYHSDPRQLDTVFIGTITGMNGNMNTGIYDIECKGDGRELTVPAVTESKELSGLNYSEIIATILRSNPNVVHFGKVYGTFLERFSRDHYVLMALGKGVLDGGLLTTTALVGTGVGMACITPMLGAGLVAKCVATAGLSAAGVGVIDMGYAATDVTRQALSDGHIMHKFWAKNDNWMNSKMSELKQWYNGALYDAGKSSSQIAAHLYETYELNNDPIDDNIFAVDIWGSFFRGESMRVDNQRSIWSVLQDIKRMYPNFALDVRPYGNRSTIFLGPSEFTYWRTDDPLIAMAPQLLDISNKKLRYDDRARNAMQMNIERDRYGNITPENMIGRDGIAPMIPFQKQHIVTSFSDIVLNGIRATPERGWNEVVIQHGKNADDKNTNPEAMIIKANQNIEPGVIKRQYIRAEWITDPEKARHYAIGVLKEGVEKMYGGTLVVRGNPKIEPNDRVYVCDKVNKMYGWIEVETVIHKFDQQSGYTTHIVPNMVCNINSDAYMTSGHIARKLVSDKISQTTLQDIGMLTAGLAAGTILMPMLGAAFPLLVTLGGGALLSYALYDGLNTAAEKSKDIFGKYSTKNDDEYITSILENSMKAKLANETVVGGYTLSLLIKAVRYVKGADAAGAISTAYNYAAIYASTGKEKVLNTGTNVTRYGSRNLLSDIAAKMGKDVGSLLSSADAETQIEKWIKELKENKATEKYATDIENRIKGKDGIKKVLDTAKEATTIAEERTAAGALGKKARLAVIEKAGANAGIKAAASGIIKTGFFMALLSSIETIPMMVEGFCINAMTNANVIVLHPVWVKNSLLLSGMDGYRTTSAFMHLRDQIMFAKKSLGDAYDAVADWAPTLYGGSAPVLESSSGLAYGRVSSADAALNGVTKSFLGDYEGTNKLERATLDAIVTATAIQCGLGPEDVENLKVMIQLESGWDQYAVNKKGSGASGLFQFVANTGKSYGLFPNGADKRLDPYKNIEAGIKLYIDNKKALISDKFEITGLNLFIYHNLGATGGKDLLTSIKTGKPITKAIIGVMANNDGNPDPKAYYKTMSSMWNSNRNAILSYNKRVQDAGGIV